MITNKSKGFTIIELLVVVAIIAVLAAIVLVNVTSYINKGKDAAIQGNLATQLVNAAVYVDAGTGGAGTPYSGFCASSYVTGPEAAITNAGGTPACSTNTANTTWCSCSTLKATAGQTFCVDYTGAKKSTAVACATECPDGAAAGAGTCQ